MAHQNRVILCWCADSERLNEDWAARVHFWGWVFLLSYNILFQIKIVVCGILNENRNKYPWKRYTFAC